MLRSSFTQVLNVIRAAVVVTSVSALSIGAVSLPQSPARAATTTFQSTAHASHLVQAGNERWE